MESDAFHLAGDIKLSCSRRPPTGDPNCQRENLGLSVPLGTKSYETSGTEGLSTERASVIVEQQTSQLPPSCPLDADVPSILPEEDSSEAVRAGTATAALASFSLPVTDSIPGAVELRSTGGPDSDQLPPLKQQGTGKLRVSFASQEASHVVAASSPGSSVSGDTSQANGASGWRSPSDQWNLRNHDDALSPFDDSDSTIGTSSRLTTHKNSLVASLTFASPRHNTTALTVPAIIGYQEVEALAGDVQKRRADRRPPGLFAQHSDTKSAAAEVHLETQKKAKSLGVVAAAVQFGGKTECGNGSGLSQIGNPTAPEVTVRQHSPHSAPHSPTPPSCSPSLDVVSLKPVEPGGIVSGQNIISKCANGRPELTTTPDTAGSTITVKSTIPLEFAGPEDFNFTDVSARTSKSCPAPSSATLLPPPSPALYASSRHPCPHSGSSGVLPVTGVTKIQSRPSEDAAVHASEVFRDPIGEGNPSRSVDSGRLSSQPTARRLCSCSSHSSVFNPEHKLASSCREEHYAALARLGPLPGVRSRLERVLAEMQFEETHKEELERMRLAMEMWQPEKVTFSDDVQIYEYERCNYDEIVRSSDAERDTNVARSPNQTDDDDGMEDEDAIVAPRDTTNIPLIPNRRLVGADATALEKRRYAKKREQKNLCCNEEEEEDNNGEDPAQIDERSHDCPLPGERTRRHLVSNSWGDCTRRNGSSAGGANLGFQGIRFDSAVDGPATFGDTVNGGLCDEHHREGATTTHHGKQSPLHSTQTPACVNLPHVPSVPSTPSSPVALAAITAGEGDTATPREFFTPMTSRYAAEMGYSFQLPEQFAPGDSTWATPRASYTDELHMKPINKLQSLLLKETLSLPAASLTDLKPQVSHQATSSPQKAIPAADNWAATSVAPRPFPTTPTADISSSQIDFHQSSIPDPAHPIHPSTRVLPPSASSPSRQPSRAASVVGRSSTVLESTQLLPRITCSTSVRAAI